MVKKRHILFIVENNPVPQDVRVWAEAKTAHEYGYEVSIICPRIDKSSSSREKIDGIEIYRHFTPFEASGKYGFLLEYVNAIFWEFILSLWIFLKSPFQAIHSANPPDHVFMIAMFFKLFGVKYIFDQHDICPENYVAKFQKKDFLFKAMLIMEKLSYRISDIVISTNKSYRQIAITRGNKDAEKVFVVRNGPRLSSVNFVKPNPRLKEGFDYLVSYVGIIGNQEGIDVLLRIVDNIVNKKNIYSIKFIVVGTGPHWKNMVSLSEELELKKFVEFTGYIPYFNLYEILSTSDLCVNPEYCNEFTDKSTMLKIMDYMTFGKPIVMFRTKEGSVTAGDSAVYIENNSIVKFADAIVDTLNNRSKRVQMGEFGKQRILNELNWDVQKRNLLKAYEYLDTNFS